MPTSVSYPINAFETPLIDAGELVPGARILIKDETRYASGSHKEPAARAVVARAIAEGKRRIVIATCGNYGRAMAMGAGALGMPCTVVLPAGWSDGGAFMREAGADVVLVDGAYEDAVDESKRLAQADGAVDGNVDGPYVADVFAGHGLVAVALHAALGGEPPAALWVPVGNGTTVIAIARRFRDLGWDVPIHGVGSAGNNPIVTSWPGEYRMLGPDEVTTTDHNQPLVNWHALQGAEAMAAIAATGGAVHAATDEQLLAAQTVLHAHGAHPTAGGSVAMAGLLAATELSGTHVVLLSGR
ncbi:pyridoxal-phosphate dependent enzyme [Catenuloplanes japonicus]|uniref:pyridoxal-phosphate dependent enzyme n=1 Tax=Catenuloplanes japonicus TaxID=33876 RepID=UPI00068EACB9|nr:pyridoxal-phosphate dependent enzyme [Catenuloplanes japonicus]